MKKLTTLFVAALMVAGSATSAFAVGPSGQDRGRDNRSFQSENVRGGNQGRYESERNGQHGRYADSWGRHGGSRYSRNHHAGYRNGWGHRTRFEHAGNHRGAYAHGWGR